MYYFLDNSFFKSKSIASILLVFLANAKYIVGVTYKVKKVEKQSNIYKKQLLNCRNSLNKNKYIIF